MNKKKIKEILEKEIEEIPYMEAAMRYMVNYHNSSYRDVKVYRAFKKRLEEMVKRRQMIAKELGISSEGLNPKWFL